MQSYKAWRIIAFIVLLAGLSLGLFQPGGVRAMRFFPQDGSPAGVETLPPGQIDPLIKIEPALRQQLAAAGQTDFFIWLTVKADLNPAYRLKTKQEKGQFVFETLKKTAESSQQALRRELDKQQLRYKSFYISNKILVFGGNQSLAFTLANRPDVARITANRTYQLDEPKVNPAPPHVANIEPNLGFIKADEVWAMGITGQDIVLAGNDTGLSWDHPALIDHYRGWNGSTVDHNYNWWDATGTYPAVPEDFHGHGTHTTGTMVGDDGGSNRIGVAPGAKTIHCKNMTDDGFGTDASASECFQWNLAPWDLSGANPRPDLAPDAVNNSWGDGGGNPVYEDEIDALQAAGIVVEVSVGNWGPGCGSLGSPGDYRQVLTTGSVNHAGGILPGLLTDFSSRGPSALYPDDTFPDVMAPGENIRSSLPGNTYEAWSGTSMSGPHTTALVGLMWAANPALRGLVAETIEIIQATAAPLSGQTGSNCGGDYDLGPNNDWGFGTIDALAAVNEAQDFGEIGTLTGVVSDGTTPIAEATIKATLSPTRSRQTGSNELGIYSLTVLSGTYTVNASKYGYKTNQVTGISVISGTTTTLNINLSPADMYSVSGFITDSRTGWPLYASLDIEGYPGEPVWSDPVTGHYSVTLAAEISYTFRVNAWSPGYETISREVGPLVGHQSEDFGLAADIVACNAPGYSPTSVYFEDFENGLGNWKQSGLWNLEAEADTCGALVAPFPSSGQAAYYGLDDICTFNNGNTNTGALTLATPIKLSSSGNPALSVQSYESTECFGDCFTDNRYIELSTNGGWTWNTLGEGFVEGFWYPQMFDLTPYLGEDVLLRFRFDTVDSNNNDALGWMIDNVSISNDCQAGSGGLAVGNVYDLNRGEPVNGASVTNEAGQVAVSGPTPGDPAIADGFYTLFSPAGPQVLTATMVGYGVDIQTPTFIQDEVIRQDFNLPAGLLSHSPAGLEITLGLGQSGTLPFTLTNEGGLPAAFELQEVNGDFIPLALPAGSEPSTPVMQATAFSSTLSGWGKGPAPANRRHFRTTPLITTSLPVVIDDPAGDAAGIDLIKVKAAPMSSEMVMRLEFRPGAGPASALGYIHLDTDQNATTGLPPSSLFGLPGQDIGFDYYLNLFNLPFTVDIYDANATYLGSVTPAYEGNALEFAVPLSVLGEDEGLMDVTMVLGNVSGPADWAPDGGHGSISPGVPWLSENPDSGTLESLASQAFTISFDTRVPAISQPGIYYAQLLVVDDTPHPPPPVPVTMTVVAPANYGKLRGTVTGLEMCDAPGAPLEGAAVLLQSGLGLSQTLIAGGSGVYQVWLDEAHSPLTATVSHAGYITRTTAGINVTAGLTTTVDFDLRLDAPCIQIEPVEFNITLSPGLTTTQPLTLTNTGAGMAFFEILEANGGYTPLFLPAMSDRPTRVTQTKAFSSTLSAWGELPALAVRRQFKTSPLAASVLPVIIDDPVGDATGIDLVKVKAAPTSSEMLMRLEFSPGAGPINALGYIHLDTDQNAATGLPPTSLAGLPTQDVGLDYFLSLFNLPTSVDIYDINFTYLASVTPVYEGDALEFAIPLSILGNDDGLIDVTMALGDFIGPTDWGPDVGHGSISPGIPWLSENPISGTIGSPASQAIDLIFDAGGPEGSQPGQYYGQLLIVDDSLQSLPSIPVTMTIVAPASYGKLQGTVAGLEMCDTPGAPLQGANLLLYNNLGFSQTVTTGISGTYTIWLDEGHSPLTATVSHAGYLTRTVAGLNVTAGVTTTVDFELRLNAPCIQVEPGEFQVTLSSGMTTTMPLTLTNTGPAPATFRFREQAQEPGLASTSLPYRRQTVAHWSPAASPPANTATASPNFWGSGAAIPTGPRIRAGGASCDGQTYYIFGGGNEFGQVLDEAWRYDPASDTWTALTPMPTALMNLSATCIGSQIYLLGGYTGFDHTNDFQIYDTLSDSWLSSTWPNARSPMTAVWNNKLFAFGGEPGPTDETWMYDPASGQWTGPLAPMPTANAYGAAVTVGDYIYQIGGVLANTVQRYDPAADSWDNSGPQLQNNRMSALTVWYGDYIYVISGGGLNDDFWSPWDSTEIYNPSAWPGGAWVYDDEPVPIPAVAMAGDCAANKLWGAGGYNGLFLDTNQFIDDNLNCQVAAADVPWLAEQPESGEIAPGGVQVVEVIVDASISEVSQPGSYQADLSVVTNEPANNIHVLPVSLTVTPPASFGKLQGIVTGPEVCNGPGVPLEGANLLLQNGLGLSQTLTTGLNGAYEVWLDGAHSPVTAIVDYPGYVSQIVPGIAITASMTTTKNITLRLNASCPQAMVTPLASTHAGQAGVMVTHTLRITNSGHTSETFYLSTSGHNWPIVTPLKAPPGAAGIVIGPLAPNVGAAIDLIVMIPAGKGNGDIDTATVTLRSLQNNTSLATATLTTVVSGLAPEKRIYLPVLSKQ